MTKFLIHKWTHFLVLLALLAGAVYFSGSNHELRKRLQYATFDTYNKLKPRPASERVAIVDLDEESIKKLGQWPWPRSVMAELVDNLKDLGAKVIAFDVVFAEPDRTSPARIAQTLPDGEAYDPVKTALEGLPDNDAIFARAIEEAGNVITGFTRARPEETLRKPYQLAKPTFLMKDKSAFMRDTFAAPGVAENLPEFSTAAAGNGSFMATPDVDGIIRQVSLLVRYPPEKTAGFEPELYPMLGLEALRVDVNKKARLMVRQNNEKGPFDTRYNIKVGEAEVPIESSGKIWVYYRHIGQDEYISAQCLFDPAQKDALRDRIKDKIVFVGTSAEGLRDIRSTPLDIFVPGVEVHVNVVEQILQGRYLSRPDIIVGVEAAVIAFAGLLIIIFAPFMNVIVLGILTAGLMGCMFLGSWQMYQDMGLLLDPVYPSAALSFLFLVSSLLSYIRSEAEREQVRQAFGLYIAPSFMEELTKDPDKLKLGGEVRDLTVMFTDIRSFTTISEHLTPEELIHLMNDFLTPMSDLVMANRGTIDKYMGDAMMAFWNAPLDDPDHARHACLSALKMNEALIPVNEGVRARAEKEGRKPVLLNAGIGINTGPCSVGNMGSRQRFAYSALGDAVNLASRLEGQTKAYGVSIMLGEATLGRVQDLATLELDLIRVKGKEKPVRIYTLVGDEAVAVSEGFKSWKAAHSGFLAAYRAANFRDAAQALKAARDASGGQMEGYYDLFTARLAAFAKNPPPESWDGVFVATEK
jgi:adenylate cyclase